MSRPARLLVVFLLLLPTCTRGGGDTIRVRAFDLDSALLGMTLHEVGLEPPALASGARRPLLVFLHGLGASPSGVVDAWRWPAALGDLGDRAPAVVIVDGGRGRSYYHDRRDAPWGRYVLDEVIPEAVKRLHADPERVAIGGYSMGGFGALDLARLSPGRFCAVGGHSAALLRRFEDTRPGAFDDAADFAAHDLFAAATADPGLFGQTPVWLDAGGSDPYLPTDRAFAEVLRIGHADVSFSAWSGGHNDGYWRGHLDDYLGFYADALEGCA